jgi:glutamate formiminotransferase/formiminotetrahydrofolate cyclodeaminase
MREIIPPLQTLTQALIPMIDADTNAFNDYMEGLRMPKNTEKEKAARTSKMQKGLEIATSVPLKTMQLGNQAWNAMCDVARYGNMASKSDIQVGARCLETGIWGAYQNVLINVAGIKDPAFKENICKKASEIMNRTKKKCAEVLAILEKR